MTLRKSSTYAIDLVNRIKKGVEIKDYVYSQDTQTLDIHYKSGKQILFKNIDNEIFEEFKESNDNSKFLSSRIVGKYSSQKLASGYDDDAFEQLTKHMDQLIRAVCRKYFLTSRDYEDTLQDARISLYKAAQDYDESKNIPFENFAVKTCIKRRIYTEIKKEKERQKSRALNESTSLDAPLVISGSNESGQSMYDLIEDVGSDPLEILIENENRYEIRNFLDSDLTELESAVLEGYESGDPYREIASKLEVTVKCVDNSLGRIRKKASRIFKENDTSVGPMIYRGKKRK